MLARRQFALGAILPAALLGATPKLKITRLDVHVVRVSQRGDWLLLELHTDKGVTGIGEASHGDPYAKDGDARTLEHLRQGFEFVRDTSPFDIAGFRQRAWQFALSQGRPTATAFSGIEQAMWDCAGKALGVPVHEMLGGKLRDRLKVYANINRATNGQRSPDAFAANAAKAVADGFRAIKAAPFDHVRKLTEPRASVEEDIALGIACVEAIRREIGGDVDLLIDMHSHLDRALSISVAKRLEPANLYWYEEPVDPHRLEDTKAIRESIRQTLAGGEALFAVAGFAPLCKQRAVGVIMPDVKHCGGVLEARRIAAYAEQEGNAAVAPHNPSGPVATAASVEICSGIPNFDVLEHAWGEVAWSHDLVEPREEFWQGYIRVTHDPGFGVSLNRKVVEAHL